jgi:RNA polymerase sigma factor (sigma-70 family)
MDDGPRRGACVPTRAEPCEAESTTILIARAQSGDRQALDELFARYLPRLRRWASGRLPRWARDVADTHDLVQETLLQTFKNIDGFEQRHDLALQAYLRQAIANRVRDELRRHARHPAKAELDDQAVDGGASPLEITIGRQAAERYEAALARLDAEERELIVARLEMGFTYQELATALGRPSGEAARKACERALVRLAEEMRVGR